MVVQEQQQQHNVLHAIAIVIIIIIIIVVVVVIIELILPSPTQVSAEKDEKFKQWMKKFENEKKSLNKRVCAHSTHSYTCRYI